VAKRLSAAPRIRSLVEKGDVFISGGPCSDVSNDRLRIRPERREGQTFTFFLWHPLANELESVNIS
jgi:hypothetical protein